MSTINLTGGLGNQLFQVCALMAYCFRHKQPFYFERVPCRNSKRPFYWNNFFKHLSVFLRPKPTSSTQIVYREPYFHYKEIANVGNKPIKLYGYFQSCKYFKDYEERIFEHLQLTSFQYSLRDEYEFKNTISLHFRLGDYKHLQHHHNIQTLD